MNDFTKEELIELLKYVSHPMWTDSKSFILKIQSIIDNYRDKNCAHEIDKESKKCKLCALPSYSIPCVGGWL